MSDLFERVVQWQRHSGRHTLPWQNTRDPYRVWLSEIMLQQTQVSTVLGYFDRFLARFPNVQALAEATQDEVLGLWSGLGYYSRARNLHACAQQVVAHHGGEFPRTAQALTALPGIGPSTAAAIAAFCFHERVSILDGNVKRVLGRALGFAHDLAVPAHERALWAQANALLPGPERAGDMPAYTQGLMDLGATVCTTRKPSCLLCPLSASCVAQQQGQPEGYPVRSRRVVRRSESWWLLVARREDGAVWLQRRGQRGIWAGLHCPPVFSSREALMASLQTADDDVQELPSFVHVLTHRDLHLHPVLCREPRWVEPLAGVGGDWVSASDWPVLGMPAPVRRLLQGS